MNISSCKHTHPHSKKSSEVRHRELLEGVSGPLLQLAGERAGQWALSKPHSPLLLEIAASLPGGWVEGGGASYMCLLTSLALSLTGPLNQLFNPLLDLLAMTFDPDDHLVVHPCGHWVVKRLLGSESGGKGEEEGKGQEEGPSFAEMILDRVAADDIRAWTTTNRGAFVTCGYKCIYMYMTVYIIMTCTGFCR